RRAAAENAGAEPRRQGRHAAASHKTERYPAEAYARNSTRVDEFGSHSAPNTTFNQLLTDPARLQFPGLIMRLGYCPPVRTLHLCKSEAKVAADLLTHSNLGTCGLCLPCRQPQQSIVRPSRSCSRPPAASV